MSKYIINGGNKLKGEIEVKGAKNQCIKMIPASLLTQGPTILRNVPDILDIKLLSNIVRSIGGEVTREGDICTIDPKNINKYELPADLTPKLRASFLFIIPLLHKFGKVIFPHPGGDKIGRRPIDMILDFLKQMGATIKEKHNSYTLSSSKLKAIDFTFKWITHTGTEAIIMAAVLADGVSTIKNVALEPEVIALCEYLNSVGAKISGVGTTTLTIRGVDSVSGGECEIIPDRIEAGTFAILGALIGDPLTIKNIRADHLDVLWKYFDLMNIPYKLSKDEIVISQTKEITPQHIKTHEYPGFITDLQPPMTLMLTQAKGQSIMHETVFEGRLFYTDKLNKMGANIIMADPHRVIIHGPTKLYRKKIGSPDIRAGITLVLGALIAEGKSEINNTHHIERGYENLVKRLQQVGADIKQVD